MQSKFMCLAYQFGERTGKRTELSFLAALGNRLALLPHNKHAAAGGWWAVFRSECTLWILQLKAELVFKGIQSNIKPTQNWIGNVGIMTWHQAQLVLYQGMRCWPTLRMSRALAAGWYNIIKHVWHMWESSRVTAPAPAWMCVRKGSANPPLIPLSFVALFLSPSDAKGN